MIYKILFWCLLSALVGYGLGKGKKILYIGPDETKYNDAFIGILTKGKKK